MSKKPDIYERAWSAHQLLSRARDLWERFPPRVRAYVERVAALPPCVGELTLEEVLAAVPPEERALAREALRGDRQPEV